jgi:hypothetical protein
LCRPSPKSSDGTLCTTIDHHSCAIPYRQSSQDRKIRPANAASPDNRGKRHHQETSRGNQRSSWGVLSPLAAWAAIRSLPSGYASIAALIRIPRFFYLKDQKVRHYHGVWHLFVLGGSFCHFICILLYVA